MGIADDAKNKVEDLKGRAKEAAGALSGNDELRTEGQSDQGLAAVKGKVNEVADRVKDGIDSVKDKLTGNS